MADIRSANVTANVTNDIKSRPAFDVEMGAGAAQFLDTMMASIGNIAGTQAETSPVATEKLPASFAERVHNAKKAERPDAPRKAAEAKEPKEIIQSKIREKMAELARRNETPVTDDRAIKALKKMASFLLKAQEQGQLELPAAMTDKLEEFVAKIEAGGTELKAADIALFLHDFSQIFRQMNLVLAAPAPVVAKPIEPVSKPPVEGEETLGQEPLVIPDLVLADQEALAEKSEEAALVWPPEIVAAFAELKLSGHVKADQPITPLDVLKAVKTLVSVGEKAAIQSLRDSAQSALALQSEAQILIPVAVVDKVVDTLSEKLGSVLPALSDAIPQIKEIAATLSPMEAQNLVVKAAMAQAPLVLKPDYDTPPSPADAAQLGLDAGAPAQKKPADALLDGLVSQKAQSDLIGDGKPYLQQSLKQAPAAPQQVAVAAATAAPTSKNTEQASAPMSTAAIADAAHALADSGVDGANPMAPTAPGSNGRFAKALNAAAQAQQNQPSSATQQVLVQIQNRAAKSSHISVQLSPAELGRVDVRLNIGRDGQAYAVVMADKPETLALLQRDSASLEKSLQNAGLNASAGNMSFNLREQRQHDSGGFSRSKRLGREEEIDAPAELALNVHSNGQIISDTRVNYHA